ncbi:putative disease resistance RPP13-like protein 1 [Phoenix dactylifera]|uniref:Disease resistance RPP13-like protein 1 n=1 Tax=Phoenix dactylifera TaxID=42345 RepID=A0A8B8ZJW0_PHODC|nr:putative disease resistance RPP13-like protein 1 [Phoenix dactylifera]
MVFKECEKGDMHVLSDVGMRIIEKCDGLPLSLRTVGGVLRTKDKRHSEWEKVLSSPAWSFSKLPNEKMGPLYLSYLDLPPPLKQCFTSLSLFPKDSLIFGITFANSCIADGFVTSEDDAPLEDWAEGYWKELVQRNLLQPDSKWYDQFVCRMHDLLRSLAQHIAGDECFIGMHEHLKTRSNILEDLVILSYPTYSRSSRRSLQTAKKISSIANLSTSLGDLVHLRRLDLSHTKIREIPESIGNLRNLLFLILEDCEYLHNLPNGVVWLINLRVLDIRGAPLDGLPVGIGRLKQLRSIRGFVANGCEGCRSGVGETDREQEHKGHQDERFCTLKELKSLVQLRNISMVKLERVSDRAEAKAAALQAKPHLFRLLLSCTLPSSSSDVQQPRANYYEEEDIKRIGEVFEELCPPPCLELLEINGYFGHEFPSWMITPSSSWLPNLLRLDLMNCGLCQQLPPLGMLPQLEYLWIKGASAVTSIGPEFILLAGGSTSARGQNGRKIDSCFSSYFPKLEKLGFENMPNWEEWWWRWEEEDNQATSLLPSLKILIINGCPELRSLPESLLYHVTALKTLQITRAHSMRNIQNLPSLTELILVHNSSLERVSNFPVLKHLHVEDCEELKVVEAVNAVEHIQLDDREAESLPEWLVGAGEEQPRFPSLHKLTLSNKIYRQGLPDWPLI